MSFFTRLSNGWELAKTSFKVLMTNKKLIIFPVLSAMSVLLVLGSFGITIFASAGWDTDNLNHYNRGTIYLFTFLFYIVNYFIIVFFNMSLMNCAKQYFDGEEVSVMKGLSFSMSRIGAIFAWAVFAGTVGMILRMLRQESGWIGRLLISFIGIAWSAAVFFVIPVIAYEQVGPYEAMQRSIAIMKEKWGEGIGANFSIGLVSMLFIIPIVILGMAISSFVNEAAGIVFFVGGIFAMLAVTSALHSIVVSAIYNQIKGGDSAGFDPQITDGLFQ